MLGTYFYHEIIRKTIISFGTLFNDINIKHKKADGTMKMGGSGPGGSVSKQDMEKLIEKATQAAPAQTIRIEQAPLVLSPQPQKPEEPYKM